MSEERISDIIFNKLQVRRFAKENLEDLTEDKNNITKFEELVINLEKVNKYWNIKDEFTIRSHRKIIGRLIIFGKKFVRKFLRWYIQPIVAQQNMYNTYCTKTLNSIKEYFEYVNQEKEYTDKILHNNIEALAKLQLEIEELKNQGIGKLQSEIEELKNQGIGKLQSEIEELKNQEIGKLQLEIEELENQGIGKLQSEIEELKNQEIGKLQSDIEDLKNMVRNISQSDEKTIYLEDSYIEKKNSLLNYFIDKSTCESEEYKIFNNVTVEDLSSYIQNEKNISVFGHFGYLINNNLNNGNIKLLKPVTNFELLSIVANKIDDIDSKPFYPSALNVMLEDTDTAIILNPYLSNYILLSKCIESIYLKINSKLVLVMSLSAHQITQKLSSEIYVMWSEEFTDVEIANDIFFRWVCGKSKKATIIIINNTSDIIYSNISWQSDIVQPLGGKLKISLNDRRFTYRVESSKQLDINFDIQLDVGRNVLNLEYQGQSLKVENDDRILNFAVKDFKIVNKLTSKTYEKENIYYNEVDDSESNYLSDSEIREKLHLNGFFEITAEAFYNKGLVKLKLPTSRYLFPNGLYYLDDKIQDKACLLEKTNVIVIYTAYRYGILKDEVLHE